MLPLVIAAGVVWGVAIKRIVDYNRYKNSQTHSKSGKIDFPKADLPVYQPKNRERDLSSYAPPRFEDRRTYIVFKDCKFYIVKGGSDEWPE